MPDASPSKNVYTLAEGADELVGGIADIGLRLIADIKQELESYLNPDYETADFASPSNDCIVSVQFVLMTSEIS